MGRKGQEQRVDGLFDKEAGEGVPGRCGLNNKMFRGHGLILESGSKLVFV